LLSDPQYFCVVSVVSISRHSYSIKALIESTYF